MLPLATFLTIGTAMGFALDWAWTAMTVAGLVALIALSFFRRAAHEWAPLRDTLFLVIVCYCAFAFGGFNASTNRIVFQEAGQRLLLSGTVVKISRRTPTLTQLVIATDSLAYGDNPMSPCAAKGQITIGKNSFDGELQSIECGNRVRLTGKTTEPYQDVFSSFDYRDYLTTQGISFCAHATRFTKLADDALSLAAITGAVNHWYVERFERMGVSPSNIGFLRALVLADRSQLSPSLKENFSICGTSHVLAVSGLHVGVLAFVASLIFSALCRPRAAAMLTVLTLWAYAVVVGLGPSVVRASIMFTFLRIDWWRGRQMPPFHSLTAALVVILLFDPNAVGNSGLWLSFSAVAGILALLPPAKDFIEIHTMPSHGANICLRLALRALRVVAVALVVTLIAQLATLPIILYTFQQFPTYFWLNNLVICPAIWLAFNMAVFLPLLACIDSLSPLLGGALDALLTAMAGYCQWAAELPCASFIAGPPSIFTLVASLLAVATLIVFLRRGGTVLRRATFAALGVAFICLASTEASRKPEVVAISASGRLNVVLSDGWTAKCLASDLKHAGSIRAIKSWARGKGLSLGEFCPMGQKEVISLNGKALAIVNNPDVGAPDCDVCLINCDDAQIAAPNAKTRFYLSTYVESGPQSLHGAARRIKPDDILSLADL